MTTIELPLESGPLLDVVRTVLTGDVPDAALIGGLAVTARVASPTTGYRATADVDFVSADDTPPTLVEVLTARHHVEEPIVIDGIKVDVIPTYEVTDEDLAGIDDGPRLFVAGHRWALDTAETVTLSCTTPAGTITVDVRLATPAAPHRGEEPRRGLRPLSAPSHEARLGSPRRLPPRRPLPPPGPTRPRTPERAR